MSQTLIEQLETEMRRLDTDLAVLNRRRQQIASLLATYRGDRSSNADASLTTMEMARQVLDEAGVELFPREIRRRIEKKFRVRPAPSLQQMLYIRATKGTQGIYRKNGKYGLATS